MTTITRPFVKTLRDDINLALVELGKKHGILLTADGATFSSVGGTFKLTFVEASEETQAAIESGVDPKEAKMRADWASSAVSRGCELNWLDRAIKTTSGGTFRIVGLLPSRDKNCVAIKRLSTGKVFICSPDDVRRGTFI